MNKDMEGNDHALRFGAVERARYVELVASGHGRMAAARELGFAYDTVRRWARRDAEFAQAVADAWQSTWEPAEHGLRAALERTEWRPGPVPAGKDWAACDGTTSDGVHVVGHLAPAPEPWAVKLAAERGLKGDWAAPVAQVQVSGRVEHVAVEARLSDIADLERELEGRRAELAALESGTVAPVGDGAALDTVEVDGVFVAEP